MRLHFLSLVLFSCVLNAELPIRIFTYVYNRPDFIKLHVKTFDAFLHEPYEYIVFNDAPNDAMRYQIEQTCKQLNVTCVRVPDHAPQRQSPSYRHMDGIHYSLVNYGYNYDGILMLVDADMFLIKPLSAKQYMKDDLFVGGYQYVNRNGSREELKETNFASGYRFSSSNEKIIYTSPCLVFMNMAKLPNRHTISFEADRVEGVPCDVGGHTYEYFKNNSEVNPKLYLAVSRDYLVTLSKPLSTYNFDLNSIDFIMNNKREFAFQYHADANFLHFYAGGSNWPKYSAEFMQEKTRLVNEYIDKQIKYYEPKGTC